MNRVSFMAMCLYYYGSQLFKTVFYTAGVLALAFMVYKLVSWALWVLSF